MARVETQCAADSLSQAYYGVPPIQPVRRSFRSAVSSKYDLVIESVGGRTLGTALAALERGGVCVTLGASASAEVTFDARAFYVAGRTTLHGFYLFTELGNEPASVGLRRLVDLVAAGQLAPRISLERPWTEIAEVAADLIARRFQGKAVLTL